MRAVDDMTSHIKFAKRGLSVREGLPYCLNAAFLDTRYQNLNICLVSCWILIIVFT